MDNLNKDQFEEAVSEAFEKTAEAAREAGNVAEESAEFVGEQAVRFTEDAADTVERIADSVETGEDAPSAVEEIADSVDTSEQAIEDKIRDFVDAEEKESAEDVSDEPVSFFARLTDWQKALIAFLLAALIAGACVGANYYGKKKRAEKTAEPPKEEQPMSEKEQSDAFRSLVGAAPEGAKLIGDIRAKYGSAKTFKAQWKAEYEIDAGDGKKDKRSVDKNTVVFKRPDKLYLESDKMYTYFDGKSAVMYSADSKLYRKQDYKPEMLKMLAPTTGGLKTIGLLTGADYTGAIDRIEEVKTEKLDGKDCYVVTLHMKAPEGSSTTQKLWVEKDSLVIYRNDVTVTQKMDKKTLTTKTSSVSTLNEFDKPVDDKIFTFTPPKDAKTLDSVRAGVPGGGKLPPLGDAGVSPAMPKSDTSALMKQYEIIGKAAPDFTYKDAAGNTRSIKGHRGKVVVICFWALPTGESALPKLQKLYSDFPNVEFVNVNFNSDGDAVKKYMKDNGYNFPVVRFDSKIGEVAAKEYRLIMIPMFYVVDKTGIVRGQYNEAVDSSVIAQLIEKLGGGGAAPAAPTVKPAETQPKEPAPDTPKTEPLPENPGPAPQDTPGDAGQPAPTDDVVPFSDFNMPE